MTKNLGATLSKEPREAGRAKSSGLQASADKAAPSTTTATESAADLTHGLSAEWLETAKPRTRRSTTEQRLAADAGR